MALEETFCLEIPIEEIERTLDEYCNSDIH